MNPLDEIEMEMGGKLKVGDWECLKDSACDIKSQVSYKRCRGCVFLDWQDAKPIEPERVKGRCVYSYCSHKSDGPNWCAGCEYWVSGSFPSPGLLQRMGMCEWVLDNNWYVVGKARNGGYPIISSRFMREDEARSLALGWQGVALRWQDGLR